jgi:release factor glutamine methyltransferase
VKTFRELLQEGRRALAAAGIEDPGREAERLLRDLAGVDRGALLTRRDEPAGPELSATYAEWTARRAAREPHQHITGCQEFHGLEFRVDRRVLVPRPETEGLIDRLLEADLPKRARIADLGTGSGCIAVTMAVKRRDAELFALDASPEALAVARENACRHGVEDRIEFRLGDMNEPPQSWWERMDAVVSNPPYVSEQEWATLEPEVRDHDPRSALVGGPSGLEAYEPLARAARDLLKPEGLLVLEIGYGQHEAVPEIVSAAGFHAVRVESDLRGIPRVVVAEGPGA